MVAENQIQLYIANTLNNISMSLRELVMANKQYIYSFNEKDNIIKMYLPFINDFISNQIISTHTFFEIEILRFVSQFIDRSKTILDIGANIGNHSIYFSKILHVNQVIAFEPQRTMQEIFEKNIELNNIQNIILAKYPLSDKTQFLSIDRFLYDNYGGTSFVPNNTGEYEAKALDSLNLQNVQFIKMDVEEHELNILQGAKKMFMEQKPILWIEIRNESSTKVEVFSLLNEYGYKYTHNLGTENYLFLPK